MATTKVRPTSSKGTTRKTTAVPKDALTRDAAAGKKKLGVALAAIRKLRGQGMEAFDELWEQVRDVLEAEPPLWRHGDYKNEADFVRRELPGETVRSVKRNILVASCFSPHDEATKGIAFLEELALYAQERAGASRPPAAIDIDRMFVTIPAGKLGSVRKRARDASVDDIRKARRALRQDGATARRSSKQEKALRAAIGKVAGLSTVTITIRGGQVLLGCVPLEQGALRALGRALSNVQLPA